MPEMPEVTTVRRVLSELVVGKTIEDVVIHYDGIIKEIDSEQFRTELIGQQIESIENYGKFLFLHLTNNTIISHLRMEGKYNYNQSALADTKHDHVIFKFNDGSELKYNDTRKFGTMVLVPKGEHLQHRSITKLGPLPVDDPRLTVDYLVLKANNKTKTIKDFLLDQTVICGLGNIYVDEILFASLINPKRSVFTIQEYEFERIINNSELIIKEAIKNGGTTIKSFTVSGNVSGKFQHELNVYGQKGRPCPRCGTPIEKMKVSGRGTHYCPKCQKL